MQNKHVYNDNNNNSNGPDTHHILRSFFLASYWAEVVLCCIMLSHRESADKVVLHTGKYEELIVCSHEIAASTAQLVAASKVMVKFQFSQNNTVVKCI